MNKSQVSKLHITLSLVLFVFLLAFPTVVRSQSGGSEDFIAYNDTAWAAGQIYANNTTITSPNNIYGLPDSGELVDFNTGNGTGVTLTVTGGSFSYIPQGTVHSGSPAPGTDAYNVFNGKLTAFGSLSYLNRPPPAGDLVLTFTGLDPGKIYELVFYAHRDKYGWDRASLVTISGADVFTNQSSAATDNPEAGSGGAIFSDPSDDSTRLPSDNDNGYIARFTGIDPGTDGEVVLTVSWDGTPGNEYLGKYANALMLKGPAPPSVSPIGYVDFVTEDYVAGWAYDPKDEYLPIDVHVYVDNIFVGATPANINRPDLPFAGKNHGFHFDLPYLSPGIHSVDVYGINLNPPGPNVLLSGKNTIEVLQTSAVLIGPTLSVATQGTAVTFSWTAVPGVDGYYFWYDPVQAGDSFDGTFDGVVDVGTMTEAAVVLWPGACFFVAVQGHNSAGPGEVSNIEGFCVHYETTLDN